MTTGKTKILIVDDEEVLRQMVGRVFKYMNIDHNSASDGLVALERLKEGFYDIIIADIRMPNMDGMELLKIVKKKYPLSDILIMTAHTSKYSYIDVIESGALDYIMKPFSVEELKAKIERMLRERNTINELSRKTAELEQAYTELLALKDDDGKKDREINYEREFLLVEIERLKEDNKHLELKPLKPGTR
ncbi:MAG: hypothetical protein IEMM0002_0278 [bacterium]|nr:MAG: hypothetical protein IEMM0002_0278 [bacterium]